MSADVINQDSDIASQSSAGPDTTTEEKKVINRIDVMEQRSRQQKDLLLARHNIALRLWRGEHYKDRPGKRTKGKKWARDTVNRVLPIIEQQISMMTDINPTGVFVPQNEDDRDYTKAIDDLTHWRAKQINMRGRFIRSEKNNKIFGFVAMYVYWDDSIPGAEDVNCRLLDPRELIVDPLLQTSNVEDAEYVGLVRNVSLDYLKYRWPDKKTELQADWDTIPEDSIGVSNANTLDNELGHTSNIGVHGTGFEKEFPMSKLTSMWYRDYEMETVKTAKTAEMLLSDGEIQTNEAGQYVWTKTGEVFFTEDAPIISIKRPKYPYGRWTVKASNVILEDRPWGQSVVDDSISPAAWPIALGVNIVIPHRWYGMDETEQLRERQYVVNDMVSGIHDHVNHTNHPKIKAEVNALVDKKQLKNTPDAIVYTKDGRIKHVEWMNPPMLGRETFSLLEFSDKSMEQSAGMPGQNMGKQSSDRTTATEIVALDRAGRGRVGMASALLDEFIARVYLLMAQTMQRHYEVRRIIRIIGANRQAQAIEITQGHKNARFDVQVQTGATTPYDKQANKRNAMELNNVLSGAYLPEVLAAYEVENIEEVLGRHQAWMTFLQYQELLMNPQAQPALQQLMAQMQTQAEGQSNGNRQGQ